MVNKVEVIVEYEIPDGYELAEPRARTPKKGEVYLSEVYKVPHIADRDFSHVARPILKKSWKPEVGKYYLFSNNPEHVGTTTGKLSRFCSMSLDGCDYRAECFAFGFCWPIPAGLIGK